MLWFVVSQQYFANFGMTEVILLIVVYEDSYTKLILHPALLGC